MKRTWVAVFVVGAACALAAWLLWPTSPFTVGLTIPARPRLVLSLQWLWVPIASLIMTALYALDARFGRIVRLLFDEDNVAVVSPKRFLYLYLSVLIMAVIAVLCVRAISAPRTTKATGDVVDIYTWNTYTVTVPTAGFVEAEALGPLTIRAQNREPITAIQSLPRIGWSLEEPYYTIPRQPIPADTYRISGSSASRYGASEILRLYGVDAVVTTESPSQGWIIKGIALFLWLMFGLLFATGFFQKDEVANK